jgi:hypothetical protein
MTREEFRGVVVEAEDTAAVLRALGFLPAFLGKFGHPS